MCYGVCFYEDEFGNCYLSKTKRKEKCPGLDGSFFDPETLTKKKKYKLKKNYNQAKRYIEDKQKHIYFEVPF